MVAAIVLAALFVPSAAFVVFLWWHRRWRPDFVTLSGVEHRYEGDPQVHPVNQTTIAGVEDRVRRFWPGGMHPGMLRDLRVVWTLGLPAGYFGIYQPPNDTKGRKGTIYVDRRMATWPNIYRHELQHAALYLDPRTPKGLAADSERAHEWMKRWGLPL